MPINAVGVAMGMEDDWVMYRRVNGPILASIQSVRTSTLSRHPFDS